MLLVTQTLRITSAAPAAPGTRPRIESDDQPVIGALRPRSVVLYNDDVNDMTHVVQSLRRSVPSLSTQQAIAIMLEAHRNGRAIVIRCPLEEAELYRDRLESCGLTATIEG
ncbi:MAG: ATP-dependent Clp protease adaptor ClpS [Chloroflexota bacterium]